MQRDLTAAQLASLAPQPICIDVLQEKYFKGDEKSVPELFSRVSKALAAVEATEELQQKWAEEFFQNMLAGGIGAGRIMSAGGANIQATLINCFVQPVGDCIQGVDDEGFPGIYEALREAAETMRRGGGVGYDFSRIRPRNAKVKGTSSHASGPCSYIDVFDKSCQTVESAGARRGAQMGVMRIDHPDVMEFITAKRTVGRWNNFNVSVGIVAGFMETLYAGGEWELVHKAEPTKQLIDAGAYQRADGMWVYSKTSAQGIWDTIMKSTYDFAEPGILFMDNINRDNNLRYCETIAATNPCGEQPLPSYGCCDLGPIILTKFVTDPFGERANFDFAKFKDVVKVQVRMLDNVLEATYWPLEQQREQSRLKRRIGVGFTGLGNALTMLKLKYNSKEGRNVARMIAEVMRDTAYSASVALALEKGAFPEFNAEKYLEEGTFASRLPEDIKDHIRKYGIRNSHLLSIAPTGTVSLAFADNASNGIEPAFTWSYTRKKRNQDNTKTEYQVEDAAWRLYKTLGGDVNNLPEYFVDAMTMSAMDHLSMMAEVQPFVDTAISKTVNIPADYPFEDFKKLYVEAHKAGLKGLATYRPNDTLGSVLSVTEAPKKEEVKKAVEKALDPMTEYVARRPEGSLPGVIEKLDYYTQAGPQRLYLVISFLPLADGRKRAIEFFMPVGQNGENQQWIAASMRLLSLAARGGFLDRALKDMCKVAWDKGPVRLGWHYKADGTRMPKWHDSEVAAIAFAIQEAIKNVDTHVAVSSQAPEALAAPDAKVDLGSMPSMAGKKCHECGAHAVIKKDGCEMCTMCGNIGSCG